ncbi:16S rRNA (cytidine(1402)-2'-O)-methyltransferase [Acetoanaerobium noterae]|uniref:16S rRNA (cytidine(1402)-2'-O)-methyltransferase n=1 Tax=Acetoanaerobium noterae TaxID=745369 RepID=UPI0028B19A5F|nr:16S rRNA (cytidine(1402)-2'-O)-methyltransferase [Acetoanaerobium noterae]
MKTLAKLYVCPTPIGNLEDITLRTIRTLEEVDYIAAEDTRHTIKLLNHLNIKKPLISLHEHNEAFKSKELIELIKTGHDVALVSDAGMPGISDPGEKLIKQCIENEVEVVTLPGPSAFITALVNSGLDTSRFTFIGFLDRNSKTRKETIEALKARQETLIFYEAPHRIEKTISELFEILGDRKIVIARELTKKYEQYIRTSLRSLSEDFSMLEHRGEMVIILEGAIEEVEPEINKEAVEKRIKELLLQDLSTKEVAKQIAIEYKIKKNDAYALALGIK